MLPIARASGEEGGVPTSSPNHERPRLVRRWASTLAKHAPIVALLIVSAVLRAYRLPDMPGSLIGDEVWYVQAARVLAGFPVLMNHLPATALSGLDPNFEHPPLAKVVMAESMRLFGNHENAWRIPSVVLGTLSIWLLYRIILALRGTREQALFGAFVLSFDSLFFLHGRIGTLDIYFVTLMLVGTWLYLSSYLELAAIAFAVGALCKMNAVLGLLAMLLYEALLARKEWRRPSWRAIGRRAVVLVLFASFFLLGLGALDSFFTRFRSPFEHLAEMGHFHAGLKHVGLSTGTESTPFEWWVNSGTFDYYFWTGTAGGAPAHVLFRGMMNGYVLFVAPLAIVYAAGRCWSEGSRLATFAVASLAANFIPIFLAWALLSRSSYIYYMLPSVPAIACALALVAFVVPRSTRWAFIALVLYGFAMSFPFRRF